MNKPRNKPNLFHRAFRVTLCYVLALQAFAAAFSIVRAIDPSGGTGLGAIICHNSGGDTPSGDAGTPLKAPCALCAIAASAVALPDPISISVQPMAVTGRIRHVYVAVLATSSPARAGMARAPPQFV